MRHPLLLPVLAFAAGILTARQFSLTTAESLAATACYALLAGVAWGYRQLRLRSLCCLLALAGAGAWVQCAHRPGPPPVLAAHPLEIVQIEGCVVEPSTIDGPRSQFLLEPVPGARVRVIRTVHEGQTPPRFSYGQRVRVEGRVRPIRNFRNPGGFDAVGFNARKQIFWTMSVSPTLSAVTLPGSCGAGWRALLSSARAFLLDRTGILFGAGGRDAELLRAMLWGEPTRLPRETREQFRLAGVYHALVVSGLHVGALALFFLALIRLLGLPVGTSYVLTAIVIWCYAFLTGAHVPAMRAAFGFTLFLIARYVFRRARLLNLLAGIAFFFLALDPDQIAEPSFLLSFLAVAAIAAFAVPLLECTTLPYSRALAGLEDAGRDLHQPPRVAQFRIELRLVAETISLWTRLPLAWCARSTGGVLRVCFLIWETFVVSLSVQIGLLLPFVIFFNRVSLTGVSANLLVVPLLGWLIPAGFVALLSGWTPLVLLTKGLLNCLETIVAWHARLEPEWRVPAPPFYLAAAVVAAVVVVACSWEWKRRWRMLALAGAAASLGVVWLHPFAPQIDAGKLEITMLDVGQAESSFLAFPDGRTAMLDGGGFPPLPGRSVSSLDPGEDIIAPYLWTRSIRKLDVLILSHAHDDHIGGFAALVRNFHPAEIWTGISASGDAWKRLEAQAHAAGVRIVLLRQGQTFRFGGTQFEVLAPSQPARETQPTNNDSLVLRIRYGRRSLLVTGDIEEQVEHELVSGGWIERSDVLKVPHHGSRTSTTPEFLGAVRPAFALIGVGAGNLYRLPSPVVLDRLGEERTATLRTDVFGAVTVETDGKRFWADTFQWQSPSATRLPLMLPTE